MHSRRKFLGTALSTFVIMSLGAKAVAAETLEEKVEKALLRQGYNEVKTNRTFLGRLRVTAQKGSKSREVILNRTTGEVLRDVIFDNGSSHSIFGDDEQEKHRSDNGSSGSGKDDSSSDDDKGTGDHSHDDDHDESGDN